MVVTRLNAARSATSTRLARGYGAKTRLSRFRPSGGGCHTWEDYRLTREQLAELVRLPGRPPGDPHRRFVLRPHARQPAGPGAEHVRRGQDDLRRGPRRQRLPLRLPLRPGLPAGNVTAEPLRRHLPHRRRCSSVSGRSRWRPAAAATVSRSVTAAVRRSDTFLTESMGLPDPECLRAVEAAGPAEVAMPVSRRRRRPMRRPVGP